MDYSFEASKTDIESDGLEVRTKNIAIAKNTSFGIKSSNQSKNKIIMKQSEWIAKASKLHKTCVDEQNKGNGSKKITMTEAKTLNELQHAIGSDHGIKQVTYNEARISLDEMFVVVKAGKKTPPLTPG